MLRSADDPPRRVHFITDADCGYTLSQIRLAPDGGLLYGELHQRPTDERQHRALPAIAVLRSLDDLPTVGRRFRPELLSSIARSTVVLDTGRVEIVSEDPPSRVLDARLQERVDAFLTGRVHLREYADLRDALARAVSGAVVKMGLSAGDAAPGPAGWMDRVDEDIAGIPVGWVQDLSDARRVLDELEADARPSAARKPAYASA